ncbi:MAG TPA: HD-GYP domain-containing protein [Gaiellaceae bacterium]|nr:HD-GYP domain-containing protein [Gaiellaceae bacterium]
MATPNITEKITRSLTLLRAFILASALLLGAAAIALGLVLTHALRQQAIDDARVSLTEYTNGLLHREVVHGGRISVGYRAKGLVKSSLAARPDIISVKVWRPDGVLAWTNVAPERIGRTFPVSDHLREVIQTRTAVANIEELDSAENAAEASGGVHRALEVYAPVIDGGYAIGALEIYADSSRIESSIAYKKHVIWLATFGVFALLWGLLVLLVRGASTTLRRQTDQLRKRSKDLMTAYAKLEESSLEAIESLNATVEAKDPYTAGHSRRVQRIAVAIGEELELPKDRLDPLRLGALFHDIGKLRVPDAILTKPGKLTSEEYELIKRHSQDGAHIVGKLGPLRATVTIIRHHHERWDGRGYPDCLVADEIPLEAAVVGLADAWDAMTTTRPYQAALKLEAAFREVREGRGTQFAPEVVDAFFAAYRRRSETFFTPEADESGGGLHLVADTA